MFRIYALQITFGQLFFWYANVHFWSHLFRTLGLTASMILHRLHFTNLPDDENDGDVDDHHDDHDAVMCSACCCYDVFKYRECHVCT